MVTAVLRKLEGAVRIESACIIGEPTIFVVLGIKSHDVLKVLPMLGYNQLERGQGPLDGLFC